MKSVLKVCQAIRESGVRDEKPNSRGNSVVRVHSSNSRYAIDFATDFVAEGWEQFDTDQDAAYFGELKSSSFTTASRT